MTFFNKMWQLLTVSQRRAVFIIFGLTIISMLLETVGIGLVIPTMTLITQNDLVVKYPFLDHWLNMFGNPSQEYLIIFSMSILVGVYLIKTVFLAGFAWMQARFIFGVQAGLSLRLFSGYLRQPYVFHLQRNSAQLIRNVTIEISLLTSAITAGMTLLTDSLLFLGLITLIFCTEPLGAMLIAIILGGAGSIFHSVTKGYLLRWGKARQWHDGFRLQHLQQGLGGAKDVKLLGREEEFLAQYNVHNIGSTRIMSRLNVMQALPRLWLELLTVLSLAVLMFTMSAQGKQGISFLSILALFAAAAFRLIPATNRILNAVQSLRYSLPATNILYSEIRQIDELSAIVTQRTPLAFVDQLELCDVTYTYPNAVSVTVLNANLVIKKGTSVGIIGESGAGKSTLIDLILGLLTPVHGQIKVDGVDIQSNLRGWQDQIGYVPQSIFLSDDTMRRNIAFGLASEQIDEDAVHKAVKAAQLDEFMSTLTNGLDTLVGERGIRLSGGQRQRIGIARALYHNPSVLVLDEATSALDTATEQSVMEAVYALQGERTLIIIAHRLSTVQHCDRLIRVERGKLIEEKTCENLELSLNQYHQVEQPVREESV